MELRDIQPLGSLRREGFRRLGRCCPGSTQEGGQAPIWRAGVWGVGLQQMEGKLQLVAMHFHVSSLVLRGFRSSSEGSSGQVALLHAPPSSPITTQST